MSSQKIKIIDTFIQEILLNNNLEYFDILFSKDMKSHLTLEETDVNDVENLKSMNTLFHQCFSNIQIKMEDLIIEKNKVFVLLLISGIHDGEKFMGLEAKGKKLEFESYNIFYFEKNLIINHQGISNIIQQLEMLE